MARWIPETAGVVLRKVDIVDWESDAAQQTIADFKIEGIPYTRVYDQAGRLLGDGSRAVSVVGDAPAEELSRIARLILK